MRNWTRLELGIGLVLTGLVIGPLGWLAPQPLTSSDAVTLGPLLLSPSTLASIAASAMAITGVGWMLRIARGWRDDPPPWRYRDR